MDTNSQGRQFDRVKCPYYLKYSRLGPVMKWDMAHIVNLSEGGVLFHASEHYDIGSQLSVMVCHPNGNCDHPCTVHVIRSTRIPDRVGLYEVVIDIEPFDSKTKVLLYQAIEKMMGG